MYDRAPRALATPLGCTSSLLGPGAYEVLHPKTIQYRVGYAPFLSLTRRGFESISQSAENDVPGPGHYDVAKEQKIVRGGQSLQYKEKRFKEIHTDAPGPGAYFQVAPVGVEIQSKMKQPSKVPEVQKVASNLKLFRKTDAPSIPYRGQTFGYEESEDGTLVKHKPPEKDNTLGPAYYQEDPNDPCVTIKYKGAHFGSLTAKRHEFKPREGPGPADYDVNQESAVYYENINIKKEGLKIYDLCIPRYHEIMVLQSEKKGIPGPGQYDIKSQFQKAEGTSQDRHEVAPFLSITERFTSVKSSTPAPGTYNETRSALESLKKATKNIPFGHTSVRFTEDYRLRKTPGPAFYNILNFSISRECHKKAALGKKKNDAFGSSVPRLLYLVKREAFTTPGPADYQFKEATGESRKKTKQLAVFVSATKRIPVISTEAPPPGSYEVQKSFAKSQGKREYMTPRTAAAKRKHASFLSGTPRLDLPKGKIPGPGAYNPVSKSTSCLSLWVSREERFKEARDDIPGPGAYQLSPLFRDTVLKRTYNSTLNNPVVIQVEDSYKSQIDREDIFSCMSKEILSKNMEK
ncbi:sperm-tail PG-rich repeat-containing protein 2 [Sphaerodactylus townsendi]|uniref:sperm-tail PG-rich repeat-containing protein 2 n=1 Tax=Sphaerodactylus townsendi TaxID=933632 RepID=UPI0020263534|nr:sperm-tail PG-rich repeat-containing protein 2 [Sphaerodactylus townsendi]